MAFLLWKLPRLLLLLSLLIILHSPITKALDGVSYPRCSADANFTANSTFKANLDLLFSSLYSSASVSGFSSDSVGQSPNRAYGLTVCRGDLSLDECQKCLNTAIKEIVEQCPIGMSADIWHDYCFLRYSNHNFLGTADPPNAFAVFWAGRNNITNPKLFNEKLGKLMETVTTMAAYKTLRMIGAGSVNITSYNTIYGLVQCTNDISKDDCHRCGTYFVGLIPRFCNGMDACRLYTWNCIVRFTMDDPFYNISAVDDLATPPPSPPLLPPRPPSPATVSPGPEGGTSGEGKDGTTKTIIIAVISVAATFLLFAAILFLIWFLRRKPARRNMQNVRGKQEIISTDSLLYKLDTIRAATDNFSDSNKLGEGGFGPVYKGTLQDGQEIAVKRLARNSGQGLAELRNEVVLLVKLQHRNLVRLLGSCLEENEKILVYEYLHHKSLDKILFDTSRRKELDWGRRYKIIEGIGRGLLYLHEDSQLKIVHRDLKASNILLDGDMNPKISDFGLAKLFNVDETHRNTSRIAGTYGYMAPEYALHGLFSTKSDVFSYVIIVLEILTGQRNNCYQEPGQMRSLPSYVWKHWIQGVALEVVDRYLVEKYRSQDMLRCIHIALLCLQEKPFERPSMATVILMLSTYSYTLPTPKPPISFVRTGN